ncbi:MAG: hypothetical protein HND47_22405 [Chloroflexi bacterium]|nr:hypothetical protein [Chloroflexota bacterium]
MTSENTRPRTVHDQLLALSALAGKVSADLEAHKLKLPKGTADDLHHLKTTLEQVGGKIEVFQREHSNMLALAEIGQVINSSLELDEVARIVMDNIVRLTKAERGFLIFARRKRTDDHPHGAQLGDGIHQLVREERQPHCRPARD